MLNKTLRPWLLLSPAVTVLLAFMIVPIAIMATYSLYRYVSLGVEDADLGFRNWIAFLTDPYYHYALWKTARVALITTAICVVVGYVPAYVIATTRYRHRWLLMLLLLLPFWVSLIIRTMSWIHVLGAKGALNSFFLWAGMVQQPIEMLYTEGAVIMGLVHFLLPFTILNIFVSIATSDRDLVAVARTLGATPIGAFREVTLPLSMPGVATGALLAFVLSAGSYIGPIILGGADDFLFGNVIYDTIMTELNWPMGATLALALSLILGAIIIIYSRFTSLDRLTKGLT